MAQSAAVTLGGPHLIVSRAITQADNAATVVCAELPIGAWVPPYGVTIYVAEAFVGGTPSINVGIAGDTDGWLDTSEITEATPACYTGANGSGSGLAIAGYYCSAATNVIATVADTTLTDGTAYVLTTYYDLSNRDLAAA